MRLIVKIHAYCYCKAAIKIIFLCHLREYVLCYFMQDQ